MPCQDVSPGVFPPPARSQTKVSLLTGNLSACQSFNGEPEPLRNSGSFEFTDPRMVSVHRKLPGSVFQLSLEANATSGSQRSLVQQR